jgi:hypothetical protein
MSNLRADLPLYDNIRPGKSICPFRWEAQASTIKSIKFYGGGTALRAYEITTHDGTVTEKMGNLYQGADNELGELVLDQAVKKIRVQIDS